MHAKSLQLCTSLCDPMDCSPPGSSVHGILQARILEWVAMPSSRVTPPAEKQRRRLHTALASGGWAKLDLEKEEEPEIKLPSAGSSQKQESSRKTTLHQPSQSLLPQSNLGLWPVLSPHPTVPRFSSLSHLQVYIVCTSGPYSCQLGLW